MEDQIRPKLDYVILCDSVSNSPEGKKTLYGLFDTINSKKFPCFHPSFSIVMRFVNGMGKHKVEVQILDPNEKIVFKTPQALEIKLNNPLAAADFVMQLQAFKINIVGSYRIKVILNGKPYDDEIRTFQVKQV